MSTAGAFIRKEVREMIPPFLFFLVVFHLMGLTRAVVREEYTFTALRAVGATIGALTVAKAVLVVDALPFARAFEERPLAWGIAWKSLLFGLIALAFHYLEELIPQVSRLGSLAAAQHHLRTEFSWPHFWLLQAWLWVTVVGYTTVSELAEYFGPERVRAALFGGAPARTAPE
ncbi:MAG: hypothetical protein MUC69_02080 [Gemmatimonadales bacterium]|jgi:hypothetical protein|nr:hypothetical protein [Gemmatimonadales bacterium]